MAVVHEDPLQVEEAGVLEDLLSQFPHIVATHAEDLEDILIEGGVILQLSHGQ